MQRHYSLRSGNPRALRSMPTCPRFTGTPVVYLIVVLIVYVLVRLFCVCVSYNICCVMCYRLYVI